MDQTNLQERSNQVQLMWAIYAQASKTLACLGDDSSDSGIAMDFIAADYKNLSSKHESRPCVGPKSGGPISSHQTAIRNMLRRPWFESVWVLQEVKFAPEIEVLCGDRSFDPSSIAECLEDLNGTRINLASSTRLIEKISLG